MSEITVRRGQAEMTPLRPLQCCAAFLLLQDAAVAPTCRHNKLLRHGRVDPDARPLEGRS
jgi:hypothetical protein